jgi:hypothetical protein
VCRRRERRAPPEIHTRLWAFYDWCAAADIPELTTRAEIIETEWPASAIEVLLGRQHLRRCAPLRR